MKYCEYCLNHGLNLYISAKHFFDCRFSRCNCDKCLKVVVEALSPGLVASSESTCGQWVANNTQINNNNNQKDVNTKPTDSSQLNGFLSTNTLEEVRGLAQDLSKLDVSDIDLRTCVLYALLKNTNFSIEETKRLLSEARSAITQSLVLAPFYKSKQKRGINCLDTDSSDECLDESPTKKLAKHVFKAKKSFPNLNSIIKNDKNSETNSKAIGKPLIVEFADISVQTIEQNIGKTSSPMIISPKILRSTQTQTQSPIEVQKNSTNSMKSVFKVSRSQTITPQMVKPITIAPLIVPSVQSSQLLATTALNPNLGPTYICMPFMNNSVNSNINIGNQIQIQIPNTIQAQPRPPIPLRAETIMGVRNAMQVIPQRPQSILNPRGAANTRSVSMNSGPIASLRPISPRTQQYIRMSSVRPKPNFRYSTPDSSNNLAQMGIKINSITKIGTNNSIQTNSIKNVSNKLSPEMKTYSKVVSNDNTRRDESIVKPNENKLCAKIITSEEALAALSAISDSNDSFNSKRNQDFEENEEYILPDEDSADDSLHCGTVLIKPFNQSNQRKDLKTSQSLLLNKNHKLIQTSTQLRLDSNLQSIIKSNNMSSNNSSSINIFNPIIPNKSIENVVQITID